MPTSSERILCCSRNTFSTSTSVSSVYEVFSPEHYAPVREVEFFILSKVEPKNIERTMRYIQSIFPLGEFPHLKRIRNGSILVCPTLNLEKNDIEEKFLTNLASRNICSGNEMIEVVTVAASLVLTVQQYEVATKLWPMRLLVPLVDTEKKLMDERIVSRFTELQNSGHECMFVGKSGEIVFGTCADRASTTHYKHAIFNATFAVGKVSDYLATDFEVYCISEPCIMCSMALLHSRVSKVYYGVSDRFERSSWGGLGSVLSIHANKQLNHRFQVFRLVLG
jgi:tRNA-specific adenosine deaminase 3